MFKHCRSDYFPWTTFRRNISNKSNLDVARLNPEPPTGYEKPSVFLLDEAFVCTGRKTSTIIIIMAMREVIEKATLILHQDKEFREPIPRVVQEAEGSRSSRVALGGFLQIAQSPFTGQPEWWWWNSETQPTSAKCLLLRLATDLH
jgi:hypothetical protein